MTNPPEPLPSEFRTPLASPPTRPRGSYKHPRLFHHDYMKGKWFDDQRQLGSALLPLLLRVLNTTKFLSGAPLRLSLWMPLRL